MKGSKGRSQLNGFLDAGSHAHGTLRFEDTFRVDGRISGRVESDGDLYVGSQGLVEGEVRVRRLFVSGRVQAQVVAQRVEVAPGGQLRGEVASACLVIEEGAVFEGLSKMDEADGVGEKGGEARPGPRVAALRGVGDGRT
ncbi:MAG TPA: polymer-forming cytoskeletal protein [Thermoanaerobaculia bacterium]|nr:polymer-forming cytoskeletal protein [Thermoanaerobaculia bacterium]